MLRALLWVHLVLGLAAGLALTVIGASGSALVYGEALDRVMAPALHRAGCCAAQVNLDAMVRIVAAGNAGWRVQSVAMGRAKDSWALRLVRSGSATRVLYVDPASGRLLGERGAGKGLVGWLTRLHTELLAGAVGTEVEGWLAVAFATLLGTGMMLWWTRRRQLQGTRRWHGLAGAWVALPLLGQALTGVLLTFGVPAIGLMLVLLGGRKTDLDGVLRSPRSAGAGPVAGLNEDVARVRATYPDVETMLVSLPAAADGSVGIYLKRRGDARRGSFVTVAFDRASGAVLRVVDARTLPWDLRVLFWLDALHFGQVAGPVSEVLWVALGLMPGVLFGTGFWMWWRRVRG